VAEVEARHLVFEAGDQKLVRKHRSDRADAAKVVVRSHIAKTLPKDLATIDAVQARNLRLLRNAQRAALANPSQVNVDKVVKLTGVVQKADDAKKKALGLEQPDEAVGGLADILALAFPDQ
jgi:hypothetical protein